MKITKHLTLSLLIGLSVGSATGCVEGRLVLNSEQAKMVQANADRYKLRPGWHAFELLAKDDCQTWKDGGSSLINWQGKECSTSALLDFINADSKKVAIFYASYFEYGTPGVRAIDVTDSSKVNYLSFFHDLSLKLKSPKEVSKVYGSYAEDYKRIGLKKVSEAEFSSYLVDFAAKSESIQKGLYSESSQTIEMPQHNEKLGIDYRAQCGVLLLDLSNTDGWARVNGEKVTSQKIRPLGSNGSDSFKMDMGLMPARDGNNYGFEFVKRNGKAFLNVQLLQNSMDAPKLIGSYPCKKVLR